MARFEHAGSKRGMTLGARVLVGRGPGCLLQIADPRVSGEHATLWWSDGWHLRDLASRNGTFVDGKRLQPGQDAILTPQTAVSFGIADDPWFLVEDGPPVAIARTADGQAVTEDGGLLAIPSVDDPQLVVLRAGNGTWMAEQGASTEAVKDHDIVVVGDRPWTLYLPTTVDATWMDDASRPVPEALKFKTSRDQEYLEVEVEGGGRVAPLEPRAFHWLLYVLARARQKELDVPDSGWVHVQDLRTMIGADERTVNVHVCRARQQLGQMGFDGARLIERRPRTGQLRLGVTRLAFE